VGGGVEVRGDVEQDPQRSGGTESGAHRIASRMAWSRPMPSAMPPRTSPTAY
jgi:hypothetical protein